MIKTRIIYWVNFSYRGWYGKIEKSWSGKFNVYITSAPQPVINNIRVIMVDSHSCEYAFQVKTHWYANEDWNKAEQMAKQYIDAHFGDAH